MLSFFIPAAPVPKARARVVVRPGQKARAITPKATRDYERMVQLYARQAVAVLRDWSLEGPMNLSVVLTRKGARVTVMPKGGALQRVWRGDLDNYAKSLSDALNGIVYKDDRQVICLSIVEVP